MSKNKQIMIFVSTECMEDVWMEDICIHNSKSKENNNNNNNKEENRWNIERRNFLKQFKTVLNLLIRELRLVLHVRVLVVIITIYKDERRQEIWMWNN